MLYNWIHNLSWFHITSALHLMSLRINRNILCSAFHIELNLNLRLKGWKQNNGPIKYWLLSRITETQFYLITSVGRPFRLEKVTECRFCRLKMLKCFGMYILHLCRRTTTQYSGFCNQKQLNVHNQLASNQWTLRNQPMHKNHFSMTSTNKLSIGNSYLYLGP